MSNSGEIDLGTVIEKSDSFVESQIDGEAILMNVESGEFSSLDATGLRIWELLEEPTSPSMISAALLEEFEVAEDVCQNQTLGFLRQLLEKNLIVKKGA